MSKPFDFYESIQQDAKASQPTQVALPGSSETPTSSDVVSQAMATHQVPKSLSHALIAAHLPNDKADVLKAQAMDLVSSETFLREASKEIGVPQAGETEDAFVARPKTILRALLSKSLKR